MVVLGMDTGLAALKILSSFVTQQEARLKTGMERRAAMAAALDAGESVKGPRLDWIRTTVRDLFGFLADKAAEFNEANRDDLISAHDLHDILTTALSSLESKIRS